MDRASLEQLVGQGLSLAEIGRRFGRHESTVAYWVQKHGLEAVRRDTHAPKGGLTRAELDPLVKAGCSIGQIATSVKRGRATVRYWLKHHGLKTHSSAQSTRASKAVGLVTVMRVCRRHGLTEYWLEGRGYYRCKRCRMERVIRRRRQIKAILVEEAGGRCVVCGYNRCSAALHFQHLEPNSKQFNLSMQGVTRSLDRAREEMAKCVLLCANCHAEVESGLVSIGL